MSDILVSVKRDPLFGRTREEVIKCFRGILAGRVVAGYFFGSFTTNDFTKFSDIDVILVQETDRPFLRRSEEFFDLKNIIPSLDILVYTPDEWRELITEPSPGFWTSVKGTLERFV